MDAMDRMIINELRVDPDISNDAIAQAVRVSEETVRRRRKILTENGELVHKWVVPPQAEGRTVPCIIMIPHVNDEAEAFGIHFLPSKLMFKTLPGSGMFVCFFKDYDEVSKEMRETVLPAYPNAVLTFFSEDWKEWF